jgi:hypothetical protein
LFSDGRTRPERLPSIPNATPVCCWVADNPFRTRSGMLVDHQSWCLFIVDRQIVSTWGYRATNSSRKKPVCKELIVYVTLWRNQTKAPVNNWQRLDFVTVSWLPSLGFCWIVGQHEFDDEQLLVRHQKLQRTSELW